MKKIIAIALVFIFLTYIPFAFDTYQEKGSVSFSDFIVFLKSSFN